MRASEDALRGKTTTFGGFVSDGGKVRASGASLEALSVVFFFAAGFERVRMINETGKDTQLSYFRYRLQ